MTPNFQHAHLANWVKGRVDVPCTKVQKEKAKLLKTPKTHKTILQRIKYKLGFLYPIIDSQRNKTGAMAKELLTV